MPKPKHGVSGSGMHINMSLSKDGVNIFDNKEDKLGLSEEAYYFIGGIMKHMKGMTVITNPIVNSYKRFVPGYEAPIYITWSATNRSPLIRILQQEVREGEWSLETLILQQIRIWFWHCAWQQELTA